MILGELLFLNEATFLENLKTRYFKDKIYVSWYRIDVLKSHFLLKKNRYEFIQLNGKF